MEERIQKIIANSGYCSRRKAEDLIEQGKVKVNGKVISIGLRLDKDKGKIEVEGNMITTKRKNYYYILNKPKGLLVTKTDPQGRKTIYDLPAMKLLEKEINLELNYVGRLDGLTEGLLMLTNDGDLTNLLTHPRHHASKTYLVKTEPKLSEKDIQKLKSGLMMSGRDFFADISNIEKDTFHMTIKEGRNRIIRNSMAKLGYNIFQLKRVAIENIVLGNLKDGEIKKIDESVIKELRKRIN